MTKFKAFLLSGLMAFLFAGGILLCGSEWDTFPWGQVIGVLMLGLLLLITNWIKRGTTRGPFC